MDDADRPAVLDHEEDREWRSAVFIIASASPTSVSGVIVFGAGVHHVVDRRSRRSAPRCAAEVAVGDDADQRAASRRRCRGSRSPSRVIIRIASLIGVPRGDQRHASPRCMMSRTKWRLAPSRPPGWKTWKLSRGEAAALEERDRERIAERELHQRRGRRRKAVRAGFVGARQARARCRLRGRACSPARRSWRSAGCRSGGHIRGCCAVPPSRPTRTGRG